MHQMVRFHCGGKRGSLEISHQTIYLSFYFLFFLKERSLIITIIKITLISHQISIEKNNNIK